MSKSSTRRVLQTIERETKPTSKARITENCKVGRLEHINCFVQFLQEDLSNIQLVNRPVIHGIHDKGKSYK